MDEALIMRGVMHLALTAWRGETEGLHAGAARREGLPEHSITHLQVLPNCEPIWVGLHWIEEVDRVVPD